MARVGTTKSLTLVELLLVTSIMAALSIAIYQSFFNGIDVWKRSGRVSTEEDVLIFFDKLNNDLARAMNFSGLEFEGQDRSVEFPTIVNVPLTRSGSREISYVFQQPGMVRYLFQYERGELSREVAYYGRALKKEFGAPRIIVRGVAGVDFSYEDSVDGRLEKHGPLDHTLPDYIRVRVQVKDDTGEAREFQRIFEIPASGGL